MVLPSNPPQDPYYNINYLTKLTLAQLQALYTTLAETTTVTARPADVSPSTSVTITVNDSSRYGNGYLIRGYQLGIVGNAYVIAIPNSTSITIQYTFQIFPEILNGTVLSAVPPLSSIVTTIDNYQYRNKYWLIAQLTGQSLTASQIENEFSFPGLFKLSDYYGLSIQLATKPLYWSQFYGITNDYFPYEVDPINVPISSTQTASEFIGGPSSSLTLLQAGWVEGNTIPTALQTAYTNCVGTALIDSVELHIGGQLIEVITGEYIQNYMDMTTELQNKPALTILYGKDDYSAITNPRTYIINLPFYFYRESGLALPLVALYRQDVELYFKFNNFGRNYNISADYSQFVINPGSMGIRIVKKSEDAKDKKDRTQIVIDGGSFSGNVYADMNLLVDLTQFGVESNAVTVIDSAYPITVNGINYSLNPGLWNSIILNSQNSNLFSITGQYPQVDANSLTVNVITTSTTGFIVPGSTNTYATNLTFNGIPGYVSALRDQTVVKFNPPLDILSITSDGTKVTVTTKIAHELTDQSVYIDNVTPSDFNGRYMIDVTGADTFTYQLTYEGTGEGGVVYPSPVVVSNIVGNGTTTTVYTRESHYLASQTMVTLAGCSNVMLNGDHVVNVTSQNSFTFNSIFTGSANGYISAYTIPSGFNVTLSEPAGSVINPGTLSVTATPPSSTKVEFWVRFSPDYVRGGTYDKQLLFVFPLLQPKNIQPYVMNMNNFINATVIGEYAYLTGPELNFFRTRRLTYLIGQVQVSKNKLPKGSVGGYFELKFINPVSMIQVFIRNDRTLDANKVYLNKNVDLFDYSQNGLINMGLYFNGQEAFTTAATDAVYLGALEVLDKRTAPAYSGSKVTSNIFMYSFSLKPEVLSNPSGHVNMSRIKQQVLEINMTSDSFYEKQLDIYALNYNILRVEHGLAGLAFNSSQ